tara:strand:- start:334 stop:1506 length:1173 start_codon:yes stop_codon:yes gene_type:complete
MFDIKVLVPIWGKEYFDLFFKVNLNSFANDLSNLPKNCTVTLSVYCSKKNQKAFVKQMKENYEFINGKIDFNFFESFGINTEVLPSQKNGFKYEFISSIQKHFFETATMNSILIFNYADFFWSNNSLKSCILKIIDEDISIIFSFCPPVKRSKILSFLSESRLSNSIEYYSEYITTNFEDLLHDEIWRRKFTNKKISVMPSYLIWKNKYEVIFHSYHQTILAVKKDDSFESAGLNFGTLDGYSAGEFFHKSKQDNKKIYFMNDLTKQFVVSLHPDNFSSEESKNKILGNKDLSDPFYEMFKNAITTPQMEMALVEYKWIKPNRVNIIKGIDNNQTQRILEINKKYGYLLSKNKNQNKKINDLGNIKISRYNNLFNLLKTLIRRILFKYFF